VAACGEIAVTVDAPPTTALTTSVNSRELSTIRGKGEDQMKARRNRWLMRVVVGLIIGSTGLAIALFGLAAVSLVHSPACQATHR